MHMYINLCMAYPTLLGADQLRSVIVYKIYYIKLMTSGGKVFVINNPKPTLIIQLLRFGHQ